MTSNVSTPFPCCSPFAPFSVVCSTVEPLPKWCLASLTADWSGLSAPLSTPFPSPRVCVFPTFPCCLNFWAFSVVVPDLSDCRLVRVFSAAPTPSPPVPLPGQVPRKKLCLTADWSGLSGFPLKHPTLVPKPCRMAGRINSGSISIAWYILSPGSTRMVTSPGRRLR